MMVAMMRMMGGGARQASNPAEPEFADERRLELEAERAELRTPLADGEPRSS